MTGTTPPSTATTGAPQANSGSPHGPMAPMMGAGFQQQDQDRESKFPIEAEPGAWVDGDGVTGTIGRPMPAPSENESSDERGDDAQDGESRVDEARRRAEELIRDLRKERKIR